MRRISKSKISQYAFIGHDYTKRGGRKSKFRQTISIALKNSSYEPLYADTSRLDQIVLKDIIKKIRNSKLCIFDLTGYKKKDKLDKNLNVILELGISIGLGKQVFIAYREGSIDFDKEMSDLLGQYRYPYKTYKGLKNDLISFMENFGK
ncbi:MAG: nucleotide-binding protein [Nitrospinae bacterium]|nr:nucleotide-binding protein [Nitrospinota bacterium]